MIKTIQHAFNKNAGLFLAAAWLYTLSFIFTNYLSYSSSSQKVANILSNYIEGQEKSFKNLLNDTAAVAGIILDGPSSAKEQIISDAQGIFVYQVNDLGNPVEIFWNTNKMAVENDDLLKTDGSYIVNYQNGVFELIKSTLHKNNTSYFFVSLIPIRWQYFMQNEYLQSKFAMNESIGNNYELTFNGDGTAIKTSANDSKFGIKEINQAYSDSPTGLFIFFRVIALLFLFIFLNKVANDITVERNFMSGYAFLIVTFLLIRLIILFFRFPFNYRIRPLFDTNIYHGGSFNHSLGDLLLNMLMLLWIILFFRKKMRNFSIDEIRMKYPASCKVLSYVAFPAIPMISFYITYIITSLVAHSNISFNTADFFSLSIYSFIGFIIICIALYVWIYLVGLFVKLASLTRLPYFWQYILIVIFSFLIITTQIFFVDAKILLVVTGFVLALYIFIQNGENPSFTSLVSSSYFIIWALILTAFASSLMVYQNSITEKKSRLNTAKAIKEETDSSGIFLVHIALQNFSDDFLQNNFERFKNPFDSRQIKDSLIQTNLSAYLNKYTTKVYVFDNNNAPLYNDDSTTYDVINSVVENRSKPTKVQGLYVYRNLQDNYNYIYEKRVTKDSSYLGSLFVLVQPRSYENTTLVPELLRQTNSISTLTENGYVFGIYDNRKLVSSFTGFNFADTVTPSQLPVTGYYFKDSLGYSQLWYNTGNNKLLVIAKKNNWVFNLITLFAYLFVLFIILAFAVYGGRKMINDRPGLTKIRDLFRFNLRSQIQLTFIGVSILSFLVIGIVTISFFIHRFNVRTTNQLITNSQIIAHEIEQMVKSEIIPDNDFGTGPSANGSEFEKQIEDMASIHNTDINFYAKNGALIVSSQPFIYTREILSTRMNPFAFNELHYNQSTRITQIEKIGNFSYNNVYMPIKDEKEETIAYLNIPSLRSQNELKEEISDFLVTLIILNALIFIFAGAIAVAITGRITSSLELIGNKMKDIKIGALNEEIEWKGNDEIGMLISEYNKMVKQLEQSAEALAKSEREGAWRQMARQVAHEIKNPLTPMKLSIQYLQKAMQDDTPNAVELSKKLASTLIEQIDQLSKIAGDFSQFANIENISPERFDITELLNKLVNLYKTDSGISIQFNEPTGSVEIISDKSQINRLFTNLIKNAIEAYPESEMPRIQIKQYTQDKDVVVAVTDYGSGIEDSLQSKIFTPNFTTKSSGTGLGLAICKAIVDKAGGKIWFATSPGAGTTFYVKLPLA